MTSSACTPSLKQHIETGTGPKLRALPPLVGYPYTRSPSEQVLSWDPGQGRIKPTRLGPDPPCGGATAEKELGRISVRDDTEGTRTHAAFLHHLQEQG